MKKIGVVGVGNMGFYFASNFLKANYQVIVNDVNEEALKKIEAQGAVLAKSPKELAEKTEIVVLSLPNPQIVEQVVAGPEGLLSGLKPSSVIIDMSTIDPGTSVRLSKLASEKGIYMLDAPVSGGVKGAANGTLTIMVGGDERVLEKYKDDLNVLGKNIIHMGPAGSGQMTKLCNNMATAVNAIALAEVLLAGCKAGLDLEKLRMVLGNSTGSSFVLTNYAPLNLFKGDLSPMFALNLMYKDVSLFLKWADELNMPAPISNLGREIYRMAKNRDLGNKDFMAVFSYYEEISNSTLPIK